MTAVVLCKSFVAVKTYHKSYDEKFAKAQGACIKTWATLTPRLNGTQTFLIAELQASARERSPIAKKIWLSIHPWNFGKSFTVRPSDRPHHKETNMKSHNFKVMWEPVIWYCTAVKTGNPLSSITWTYRGLRCQPKEVTFSLKLSADKLPVLQLIAGSAPSGLLCSSYKFIVWSKL